MRAFVLGAGVSKQIGYPLGVELFDEVDRHIKSCRNCFDRFDYRKDWRNLLRWLNTHRNPLIAEAHRQRLVEYLFTLLDIGFELKIENSVAIWHSLHSDRAAQEKSERDYKAYARSVRAYEKYRQILLLALRAYLEHKHQHDHIDSKWDLLLTFAQKLAPGDVVITFNYDAAIERVLLRCGKWSPKNGFGFNLSFQKSHADKTRVEFKDSAIRVLHLHGAVGWYRKPTMRPGFDPLTAGDGAFSAEELSPSPRDTDIAVSPEFLAAMDIHGVDVAIPERPRDDDPVYLHPSFLKDYEQEKTANRGIVKLWRSAAEALRQGSEVYVIGYSLPKADSSALTLLLTNTSREKVHIVNQNTGHNYRLRHLLSRNIMEGPLSFEKWLSSL